MARSHERRNLPQIYRRFETIWAIKNKESGGGGGGERGKVSGGGREKREVKE